MRIVYQSFAGRYSDNPRALYERLAARPDFQHTWLAEQAHLAAFPPGVTTVDIGSPEAREVLHTADLLIANTHTELEWAKPEGARYLQTWHGTPLKRVHHDVLFAPEGRLPYLDRDVARWDLMLSPNPVSTLRLRKAFGFDGDIVETGYPRNDILSSPSAPEVRDAVRTELGLPPSTTVVLYAPTWRDDELFVEGRPRIGSALDAAVLRDRLGEDVVLLVRFHNLVSEHGRLAEQPGVHDVSTYPDVSHLYLAADVLVTDYSSAMFDFSITGKPIVFYAYDLERFQNTVRGFYFDPLPEAPGPVVTTSGEVAEVITDLPAVTAQYAERYARFQDTYVGLEDGRSTDRVLAMVGLS